MVSVDFRNKNEKLEDFIGRVKATHDYEIKEYEAKQTEEAVGKICRFLVLQCIRDADMRKTLDQKFKEGNARAVVYQPMTLGNDYSLYTRNKYVDFGADYVEAAWFLAACNLHVSSGEEISFRFYDGVVKAYFTENTFAEDNPDIVEHLKKHLHHATEKAKKTK